MKNVLFVAYFCTLFSLQLFAQETKKNSFGIGNSVIFFQDWYGLPAYFNPSVYYHHNFKNSRLRLGVNFNICYMEAGKNYKTLLAKNPALLVTRLSPNLEVPLYYLFNVGRNNFAIGAGISYRFRSDKKIAYPFHGIDSDMYHHDMGIVVPISYQKHISNRLSLGVDFTFRTYGNAPNSKSIGLSLLYSTYRKKQ